MVRAYILAGGRSSRFGSNKARVVVNRTPLILKLAHELSLSGFEVTAVAQHALDFQDLPLRTIADARPNAGPLAGVQAALMDTNSFGDSHCWITSCDMLEWNPRWHEIFVSKRRVAQTNYLACVLKPKNVPVAFFLPFPGVYGVDCLSRIDTIFREEKPSMFALHQAIESQVLELRIEEASLPKMFNTSEELSRLLKSSSS